MARPPERFESSNMIHRKPIEVEVKIFGLERYRKLVKVSMFYRSVLNLYGAGVIFWTFWHRSPLKVKQIPNDTIMFDVRPPIKKN